MGKRILIIDDEKNMRWAIKKALEKEDYSIYEASNGLEGLECFKNIDPHLVLLDLKMPIMDGMETLKYLKEQAVETPIIMITAHGTMESAVEAMKIGALDYISKPFDIEELKVIITKAIGIGELKDELNYFRKELEQSIGKPIIGKSSELKHVLELVEKVAETNATVLIMGESGTGKELIASAIHYSSNRKEKPYVKINCGAIPDNLIESELFGYERGAFTGAAARKIGKFEMADKGTVFLDEIGELSQTVQVKLLRVLQEKEVDRIGGGQPIKVDLRVIAATNRDLSLMVKEGSFREDLFYRLNVIPIHLPPLRERKEDISVLIDYFIDKYTKELGRTSMKLDEEVKNKMINYQWKGNIRELENVIERMVILSDNNVITSKHLPREILFDELKDVQFTLPEDGIELDEIEKNMIIQALERTEHNQTKAAKLLGITRHTLIYRMEKHQIQKEI
ncbi:sigma-54-dependent transcriptional regulator [Alkaliphilus peptidifermentans]|uniref:Stage 0 sporulation protein A homolog n=1 Tax=Alkaliphilus peptidifermentans DSM 18978 TaxID=1120976 RepID=A0A1G5DQ87_9FIRM|nr:sigma-54 dependent transcriptional regulator [Alkaliphilus peptidifermentans]SCY16855.1 two component, sigma54 specific, transcriptional regulator, Fis family [Alkaliphilus peptidifermentans DSM 18978]